MTITGDLRRFLDAQRDTFADALAEIQNGRKRSHWMWFIFPQIAGLGHSPLGRRYAIDGLAEATAYLGHPVLGKRLRCIIGALQALPTSDPVAVFGDVDAMKLRSSLTLFARADGASGHLFRDALDRWFAGQEDAATLARL